MKIRILLHDFSGLTRCCQTNGAKQQAWILRACLDYPNAADPEPPEPMTLGNSTTIHIPEKAESMPADSIRRSIRAKIRDQLPEAERTDPLEEAIRNLSAVAGLPLEEARAYAHNAYQRAKERLNHAHA